MKHQQVDDKARVWIVRRGLDGRLYEEFDPALLARINASHSASEIAEALVMAAGEMDLDETRIW
jgi:hypothetical protein